MFIIEGSDCLGKTTVANKMMELYAKWLESRMIANPAIDLTQFPALRYQHMTRPQKSFDFAYDYVDILSEYAIQDRFHIGGIVWHKDKINQFSLDRIENWLKEAGSFTLIMYCSDEQMYRHLLQEDTRGNMFSINRMIEANKTYMEIAYDEHDLCVHFDATYDIAKDGDIVWPNEDIIDFWLMEWIGGLIK